MVRVAQIENHSFIDAVPAGSTVVDLGVNQAAFALAVIDRYGCRVVGAEPVPELHAALPRHPRLEVDRVAIAGDNGPVGLHLNPETNASVAIASPHTIEVEGRTLSELLAAHDVERVALLKVDIEGAEIAMLDSLTDEQLLRIDQITIEFHDFLDASLAPDVARARARLRHAGFREFRMSRHTNGDVLYVNRRVPLGPLQSASIVLTKYRRGLARLWARRSPRR